MDEAPHALRARFEKAWDVAPLLLVAAAMLALGLTLPILDVEKFVFWESNYSVVTGVANLFEANEYLLGFIVLLFSIVFPIAKLGVLATLWGWKLTHEQRFTLLRRLEQVGRWSMLDVFAVAILVVAGKLGMVADVHARIGIYLFAAAILLSMLATWRVKKLALKAARGGSDPVLHPPLDALV
ncbi:MAG: paraquat-inducible protein A [Planctomycetes bacterium]|nr:paraquat-inducible protein A [Planctomycetota bacterium]